MDAKTDLGIHYPSLEAHWRAKKTKKHKDWNRYKKLQAATQRETRTTEKIYMEEVVSGDLKQNPKRFYSYIKSKRQESEGVSSLIDKMASFRVIAQRELKY